MSHFLATGRSNVAVIVPTRNSARTLGTCLRSIREQTVVPTLIVVDNQSADATRTIARDFADLLILAGPERSRQRNVGARASDAVVVGFIDSDMRLPSNVVKEALDAIERGAGLVIVPETTIGSGFWASVRSYERSFYQEEAVEAARFFRRDVFDACGGFDEGLDAGEDWDLTLRARNRADVGRIESTILHDEGHVTYIAHCRKKGTYAQGLKKFMSLHGRGGLRVLLDRPYLRSPWKLLWPHPLLGAGIVSLKMGEAAAVAFGLVKGASRPHRVSTAHATSEANQTERER